MPLVGLGTWQSPSNDVKAAVNWALEAGYRHFDTAYLYFNEGDIGDTLQEWTQSGKIKREDLFITTKLPCTGLTAEKVRHFVGTSLNNLKLDYVDLYLIHFPVGFISKQDKDAFPVDEQGRPCLDLTTDLIAVWEALEAEVDAGRCKAIGLSNCNSEQIERIVQSARIKPANLQIELHAYFQQKPLREVCKKHGISVCAYSPLGSKGRVQAYKKSGLQPPEVPEVLDDELVLKIAKTHAKTPAQIVLRHLVQHNIVVIPKSVSKKRIEENSNLFDFELSAEEMEQLDLIDKNFRTFKFDFLSGLEAHPEFPFHIPY